MTGGGDEVREAGRGMKNGYESFLACTGIGSVEERFYERASFHAASVHWPLRGLWTKGGKETKDGAVPSSLDRSVQLLVHITYYRNTYLIGCKGCKAGVSIDEYIYSRMQVLTS